MRAVWQLWLQLWKRMPVLVVLAILMWLGGLIFIVMNPYHYRGSVFVGVALSAFASWFWHIGQGQALRGLCRPESFLLPDFQRRLAWLGAISVLQWVILPSLLAALFAPTHGILIAAALLFVAAMGLATGCGRRVGLLIWVVFIAAGWMPQLAGQIVKVALISPWTAPLLILATVLLLRMTLLPLLHIDDREVEPSPLENANLGRTATVDGTPQPRGAIGKRIAGLFDYVAQHAMELALRRYRERPTAPHKLMLVRRLLLPHDNPQAIALRLLLVAGMVAIYFFVIMHRQHFNAAVVGAYAILLTMTRFPQLGRGMLRMRPNLADLYLTLAPRTHAEYQKMLVDALLILVPISVLTALAYTLLGSVLVHAAEPGRMLLTAAIVASSASLVALAVHLIGPEGSFGRAAINLVVLLGSMAMYWGGYWLIGAIGYAIGGITLAVVTISFGGGVWYAAQREYQRRTPCFDAPLV
ncbi:hypothetical protein SAMN05216570_3688 [Dyella sp. OK004]|uniref:hypothetical protein n=1 Tax=Dyella sp. OK004 TaxID=1855292 RepID=UPI0008E50B0D|nr:hypothetical protein [Dyella sp. OK004]SFS17920.1 hypothetical protein SAMN05216570_3688 [Dyella sp. OK004]